MVLVTEVPMLAPIMMGMALCTVSCPAPTRPTTMEVLVEEDCTRTVAKIPTIRPQLHSFLLFLAAQRLQSDCL